MSNHPLYNYSGLQKNNKKHIMYALANKQMELKQLEDEYKAKITKIETDLTAMEQVICLFDGDCSKTISKLNNTPRRKNSPRLFKNSELKSLVLKYIKESEGSITNNEIASLIKKYKGLEVDISVNVKDSTKVLAKQGLIKNVSGYSTICSYIIAR